MTNININSTFNNTSILVVGGAGFVGSNLVKALLRCNIRKITLIDNLLSAELDNVPSDDRVDFIEASITDDRVLEKITDVHDYVFHLATYHGNQSSIHDPLADHENNTLTTLKLFNRLGSFNRIRKVVYSSAGCTVAKKTYDTARATTEDSPVSLWLDSPYQISKIVGEFYSNYYFMRYGLPVVKARFQNVYGPGEILGAGRWRGTPATVWRNVTPTFVYRALKHMPLILENGGRATRDFIYVDDIVRGLMLCASDGEPGDVYNLASGVETSIRNLAETINRLCKNPTPPEIGPEREWDRSGCRFGSTDKAEISLGFMAQTSLESGLNATVSWTEQNISSIQNCMMKHRHFMPLDSVLSSS